jgi:hypothetical protein
MSDETLTIEYRFQLPDGARKAFCIRLRKQDLQLVTNEPTPPPAWTRLTHHQCPNCPLDPDTHPHCPVALGLGGVIEAFQDYLSTINAEIVIVTDTREYRRTAPVQYGISSLMGLYMVTSGCPILNKLRPMAQTHLPFATIDETVYRLTSMYLLAQFFVAQRGGTPDWELARLVELCEAVGLVNQAFSKRLLSINPQDASLNALAGLDCFTLSTAFSIDRDHLKDLEALFSAHIEEIRPEDDPILL